MEKISIVVPFYNVDAYIDTCLTSLSSQTHTNIEIICVDDCSQDRSREIVEQHAASDSRIRIISHSQNKGLGGARNTGIQHASGEYIAFVDSDDYIDENFVSVLYQAIAENQADIAVCNIWRDEDGTISAYETNYADNCVALSHEGVSAIEVADRFNPACWNKMFKRTLILENHISQPEGRYYEDVVFWLKAVFHSSKVCSVADRLYYYRQRAGSIMNNLSAKHLDDRFAFISEIDTLIKGEIAPLYTPNKAVITDQALMLIVKHLRYGESLIDDGDVADRDQMRKRYEEKIQTFAQTHGWPALPKVYELIKANSKLRDQLAQHKAPQQVANASRDSRTNALVEPDFTSLAKRGLLLASIGLNLVLLFVLFAA